MHLEPIHLSSCCESKVSHAPFLQLSNALTTPKIQTIEALLSSHSTRCHKPIKSVRISASKFRKWLAYNKKQAKCKWKWKNFFLSALRIKVDGAEHSALSLNQTMSFWMESSSKDVVLIKVVSWIQPKWCRSVQWRCRVLCTIGMYSFFSVSIYPPGSGHGKEKIERKDVRKFVFSR